MEGSSINVSGLGNVKLNGSETYTVKVRDSEESLGCLHPARATKYDTVIHRFLAVFLLLPSILYTLPPIGQRLTPAAIKL